ncbi:MAG: S16 family serine protease [Hyphomonadaceae bacterium]
MAHLAGVAMATAIVSVLTQNPIRKDIATGEITLQAACCRSPAVV